MRSVITSIFLVTTSAGLLLLAPTTTRARAGEGADQRADSNSKRSSWKKFARHSRPASASHGTQPVPPPPAVAHPSNLPILGDQKIKPKNSGRKSEKSNPRAIPAARPIYAMNRSYPSNGQRARAPNAAVEPNATPVRKVNAVFKFTPVLNTGLVVNAGAHGASNIHDSEPDPEAERIRDELKRLHDSREARQAFYEDLRQTVDSVRASMRVGESSEKSDTFRHPTTPTAYQPPTAPNGTSMPAPSSQHRQPHSERTSRSEHEGTKQALLNPTGGNIDRDTYLLVVRWAKANGTPVELALGVAWTESRLHTNPPRGAAGEVGMYQIMPARCVTEGWPARRLSNPDFNAWMGTLLLGRYYREEGSVARAAAMYVAGPGVFNKKYPKDVWAYINWYASSVDSYANYFSRYQG